MSVDAGALGELASVDGGGWTACRSRREPEFILEAPAPRATVGQGAKVYLANIDHEADATSLHRGGSPWPS